MAVSAVTVEPAQPHLVLGPGRSSMDVHIRVSGLRPGDPAPEVSVLTNVGKISAVEPLGAGRFRARFTPPRATFPQVAIFAVDVKSGSARQRGWATLPLHGSEVLQLTTKKNAKVTVTIAGASFGPHQADARGSVDVPISAPPGVHTAVAVSTDRLGNEMRKKIDLAPPPYSRVLVAPATAAASWSDPSPAAVDIFVAAPDGTPDGNATLNVSTSAGALSAPKKLAPGHYRAEFTAPHEVGSGSAELTATLLAKASLKASATVRLLPGPPVRLELRASQPSFVAGTQHGLKIDAAAFDAHQNRAPADGLQFDVDFGSLTRADEGATALLQVPPQLGGRRTVRVTGTLGRLTHSVEVALRAAAPATGSLLVDKALIRAGDGSGTATVELRDAFGNLTRGLQLRAVTTRGRVGDIEETADGRYRFEYWAAAGDGPGEAELTVQAQEGGPEMRAEYGVLPAQNAWGVSAGILWSGQSNLGQAKSTGPVVELALRPGHGAVELLVEGSGTRFGEMRLPYAPAGADAVKVLSLEEWAVAAGARLNVPVGPSTALHLSARGGWRWGVALLQVRGADVAVDNQPVSGSKYFAALGAGASFRAGPGRVLTELQVRHAPAVAHLGGNVGGAWFGVGYLVALR